MSAEYGVTLLLDGLLDRSELDAGIVVGDPHRGVGDADLHRLHPIDDPDGAFDARLALIAVDLGCLEKHLSHDIEATRYWLGTTRAKRTGIADAFCIF